MSQHAPRIVLVGAGMSGLAMAHKLLDAGYRDLVVLEKGDSVGGTWRENTYPGVACDVAARCYSYSFAPNPGWSSMFPEGPELHRYFQRVADDLGITPLIRFGTAVREARWTGDAWDVETDAGEHLPADVLITACGVLHKPRTPDIPGLEDFAGSTFHSACWDHDVPTTGRRVGLIGTGSTGVQITAALSPRTQAFTVFQRTPQWVFPLKNRPTHPAFQRLYARLPALSQLSHRYYSWLYDHTFAAAVVHPGWQWRMFGALCRWNLGRVADPELRARLTPADEPMCRRLVMSWDYYPALQQPHVEVVDTAIERIVPEGVRTADGRVHELDVLVLATGFDTRAFVRPLELVGVDGARLSEVWGEAPRAYRTVALPRFPSFFMLMGPHSPVGNQSLIEIAEHQADWIVQMVAAIGARGPLVPRQDVTDRFNQELKDGMPDTIWTSGCKSWYLDEEGMPMVWPRSPREHAEMLRVAALDEFEPAGAAA